LQIPFEFQLEVDQLWNSQSIAEQFVVSTPQLTTETDIEYLNKLTVITLDIPNTNGKPSQKATAGFVNFPDTEYWKTVASKSNMCCILLAMNINFAHEILRFHALSV